MTIENGENAARAPSWAALLAEGGASRLARLMSVIVLHAGGNYMVVTLAPSIVDDIGGGVLVGALTALFNIATVIAAALTAPLTSRLGSRRLLRFMTLACLVGALASAAATSMPLVAVGRALAGFGGGGLLALAFVALRAQSTVSAWPKVSAVCGVFWIGAAFAGPVLGGLLADTIGWRAAFVLLGVAALGYAVLNRDAIGAIDLHGGTASVPSRTVLCLGASVALISFAPLLDPPSVAAAAGVGGLALFVAAARRDRARPPRIFPRNAFRLGTDQGRAVIAKLLLGAGAMSVLIFGPLLLIHRHGTSALFAGGFVLIETLAWSCASMLAATVAPAPARRLALAGPAISLAGLVGCTVWLVGGHLPGAAASIAACGAGLGLAWPLLGQRMLVADAADADENARTMAMLSSIEGLGFAIGGALAGLAGSLAVGGAASATFDVARAATAGMLASMPLTAAGAAVCVWALSDRPDEATAGRQGG